MPLGDSMSLGGPAGERSGAAGSVLGAVTGSVLSALMGSAPDGPVPLRIAPARLRLWAIGLFLIGLVPIVAAPFFAFHDWPAFWSAGSVVGSGDLVDGNRLIAWQATHGLSVGVFPYLPASAFLLWPLAQLPLALAFWLWTTAMLACAMLAARIAARVFGLSFWVAFGATLAWAPLTGAIVIGQNTPVALLLAMLAIEGLVAGGGGRAGIGTGLLLYKPTLGLPLVGLMVVRRRGRALAVVAVAVVAWYAAGVLAAGGDLGWPRVWLDTITGYVADDAARNADKAISLPGLVARLPISPIVALVAGAAVVLVALPRLLRAPIREAAAGACLVGVAASPHAYGYEAALALPFLWWVLGGGIVEPWRTRLVVAAYVLAPFWLVSAQTWISAVAVVVLGAVVVWVSGAWRAGGGGEVGIEAGNELAGAPVAGAGAANDLAAADGRGTPASVSAAVVTRADRDRGG
ncbi:MAG TPA: glycosyltransferase 87 family protein [Candidatus Saccharimonadales bacterium]|nr:glycosyltransferase 87 family protein [Candidatus Saccharimonadales bacterium]